MAYEDLFGALGRSMAPNLVDDGPIEPQTLVDRLTRKGIADIERPRAPAQQAPVRRAPKAPEPATSFGADDEIVEAPKANFGNDDQIVDAISDGVPIPRPRPEQAGDGFSAFEQPTPPLSPQVDPSMLSPQSVVNQKKPLVGGVEIAPENLAPKRTPTNLTDSWDALSVGRQAKEQLGSGVETLKQGWYGTNLQTNMRALSVFDKIDAGDAVDPQDDAVGYSQLSPEQRAKVRRDLEQKVGENIAGIVKSKREQEGVPLDPKKAQTFDKAPIGYGRNPLADEIVKAGNEGRWGDVWKTFKQDPLGITQQFSVESLPVSAPMLLGGVGLSVFGAVPTVLGTFGLSYGSEFGPRVVENVSEELAKLKIDLHNEEAVAAAIKANPNIVKQAADKAARGAAGPALFDAISFGSMKGIKPGGTIAGNTGRVARNLGLELATEPLGEAAGQVLEEGKVDKPGELIGELLGAGPQTVAGTGMATIREAREAKKQGFQPPEPRPDSVPESPKSPPESTLPPGTQTQGGSGGASPAETARQEAERLDRETREAKEPAPGNTPDIPPAAAAEAPPEPAPQAPAAPIGSELTPSATIDDVDRAVLRAYGYNDQQITDMSAAQRKAEVEDAVASGIDPDQAQAEFAKQDAALSGLADMFGASDKAAGTKDAPVKVETSADVDAAAAAAATKYSPEQGEANNRELGHLKWNGLDGSIEVAAGGTRRGTNPKTGEPWETTHSVPYGYWKKTIGADKMHVDAYFGPEMEAGHPVYVLDENDPATGKFRQIKTFAGFPSAEAARQAYLGTSSKTPDMIGGITPIDAAEFSAWVKNRRNTTRPAAPKAQKAEQRQPKGDLSLMQYLAWRGGIRPDGDIRSMQLPRNIVVPGVGYRSLVRPGGMAIDKAIEAAREGGYLPPAPTDRPDDVAIGRQLLDMLDEESRGRKSFPEGTDGTTRADEERASEQSEADRDKLMAEFRDAGVPVESVNPVDLAEAVRIMREEGLEPDDALELAFLRRGRDEQLASEPEFDTIYDEGWWDAVQADTALQDGAASQEEGADDQRPRAEEGDAPERGDRPGAREDGREENQEAARNDDAGEPAETGPATETAEDREQVAGGFRTAKGSTYVIHEDGTTTRNKAARSDVGHEGDSGPKPRSESTIYLWPEDARRLGQPQGKWRFVFHNTAKTISLATPADNDPNDWGISPSQRDVPFETTPQVGMVPLELWKGEGLKGRQSYSRAHFGNEITELSGKEKASFGADDEAVEATEDVQNTASKAMEAALDKIEEAVEAGDRTAVMAAGKAARRVLAETPQAVKDADPEYWGQFGKVIGRMMKPGYVTGQQQAEAEAKTEQTEAGEQTVLPGAEKIGQGELAQRESDKPLKPKKAQKPADEGLFGDDSKQTDLIDEIKKEETKAPETGPSDSSIDADVKSAFDDIFAEKEKKNAAPKAEKPAATQRKREFPSYTSEELQRILDTEPNMRTEVRERMRAEIAARASGESQPRRTPQITPTKTELAGSAAKKAASGTKKSIEALGALFGGKNKLSMGVSFDSDTYAKAKPIFLDAVSDFAGAFKDIAELARILVDEVEKAFGWDTVKEMRPYLERFVQDVKDGTIDLKSATVTAEDTADEPASTGSQDQAPLEDVPAEEGTGTPGERDSERGDSGDGEAGPGGVSEPQAAGVSGPRGGGSGAGKVRQPRAGAGGGRTRLGARGTGRNGSAVSSEPASDSGLTPAEAPGNVPAVNFKITDEVELGKGTEGQKFRDNIAAITALKTIEKENRRATAEEQRALARYVGWGGLANAFADRDGNFKDGWEKRGSELAELLTPEELAAARRSTRNAHYTSETLVKAMWKAAKQLGFKGGLVLESSMGTGNFLGLVPDDIAGRSRFIGIEYDSITARIAKALYPQETVLHSALQDVPLPDGEFTLNIGNPPFGSESLRFQYKPELSGHSIHNQFFMAGLDALQPGGLQVLVVSRYLMDAQDASARKALAKKGELLGAIRLPGTAFVENARTEVVTDVLFIQRRTAAEEAEISEIENTIRHFNKKDDEPHRRRHQSELDQKLGDWIETAQVADPLGGDPITVNKYFAKRRAMILGSLERSGSMRAQNDVTVNLKDGDLATLLDQAIQKLPIDVLRMDDEAIQNTLDRVKTMGESLEIALSGEEPGNLSERDGKLVQTIERETPTGGTELTRREITPQSPWSRDLYMDDKGQWYTLEAAVDEKGEKKKKGKRNVYERKVFAEKDLPSSKRLGEARFVRLKDMVKLRDLVKRQLVLESEDAPAKEMEANRKQLASAYKAFVAKHDLLHTPSNASLVSDMPDGALVMALEINYRAGMTAARAARRGEKPVKPSADPAPIMERRVVPKYEPATKADSVQDAIQISMSERGIIDVDRVASLLGVTPDQATAKLQEGENPLAFFDPESKTWETRDNYLTGQVVKKLQAARNEGLEKNIRALEAVQPTTWTAEQVNVVIGSTWVPPIVYAKFAEFLTGGRSSARFLKATNSFALQLEGVNANKAMQWGVDQAMTFSEIFTRMLNSTSLKVMREDSEGNKYVDQEASALVALKAREIENEFADWVFADGERRNQLVSIFNEKFNTRVTRQHDGSHLTLPGKVPDEVIALRRHQKNAVWRGIHERFLLLDHVVGAGKTFTAIARIMERRRMGLSRKPMVVVPNHLVEQWAADVYRLYPGAKVLAAGKNQFDRKNRRRLFAKIATGDWDIVIVPHSSFGFIGISPASETRFLEHELKIAEEAINEAWEAAREDGLDGGRRKPHNVKEAERLAERIKARLDAIKGGKTDRLLTFEQMGVDDLTVDEAHEFKNLFYSSRLTGTRGMGDKTGSTKALGLYNKVRVLREHPTGTVTFMTGTPISNSAVEMYTMMRYLAADDLAELGLEHFDAWRTQSVTATTAFEPTESGSGLKEVTRLGRSWSNMRALMELWYSFTDAVPQEDISKWYAEDNNGKEFPIPRVKHGGRKEVVIKPTPAQERILEEVVSDFNNLPSISDPDERNATRLRLMDRARKLSLDARAVDPTLDTEEYGGKLDRMADEIDRIYRATMADKGTQLVFLDRGVKSAKGDKAIIKEYDDLIAKRDEARARGDEEAYRNVLDKLDEFNPAEIEELRRAQNGGWNAYDQLKNNLIKRGIPADQIRFVQEANNDAEKQALFDAVNDGTIRVLIGSTPRMGAGTNVQERIVALHHGDVTYKPSDIEQREGRGIRQGNKLLAKYGQDKFELEILAYVTERTIDAKMWELNATKLKMINGIRKYDGSFTMDFEDDDAVGMSEIAALASGDPMLLERVKLTAEIDKLELQERAHRRKQFGIDDQIDTLKKIIRDYPGLIEKYKAAADQFRPALEGIRERAAGRSVTVAGNAYTSGVVADSAFEGEILRQRNEAAKKAIAELEAKAKAEGREVTDEERNKAEGKDYKYSIEVGGKIVTSKAAAEEAISAALGDMDPFEAEIEGQTVNRRSRVARVVAEKASELNVDSNEGTNRKAAIGTLLGYDLELQVKYSGYGNVAVALSLKDSRGEEVAGAERYFEAQKEISVAGAKAVLEDVMRAVNRMADFSESYMRNRITEAEREIPGLVEQQGKPFSLAAELAAKRQRLLEITQELAARAEDAEKRGGGGGAKPLPDGFEVLEPGKLLSWMDPRLYQPDTQWHIYAPGGFVVGEGNSLEEAMAGYRQWRANPQANIRWQDVNLTPAALERKADIAAALQSLVRLVAGPQVRVQFADSLPMGAPMEAWGEFRKGEENVTAAGVFIPGQNLIVLALNDPNYASPSGQISTAFHEAFHSIERFLLSKVELDMMIAETDRLRRVVQRAFGFSDSEIASIAGYEIRAMAFEHYVDQRSRGLQPTGMHVAVRRAFERLMQLFRQIRNALRGMGFQTSEDIFGAALRGEIGRRGATRPRTMMDVMRDMAPEAANIRQELVPERRGVAPPPETLHDQLMARNWRRLGRLVPEWINLTETRVKLQDRFYRLKRIQKAQERETGPIPERMDAYLAESLFYGRAGEQIERLERQHIDPLITEIKKRGLTMQQVGDYLYALHAPIRNERTREINPDIENPSGMSDEEAAAILAAIPADKLADYQAIERRVRAIIDQTNETRLRGGLVSEEELEAWNQRYDDGTYVPLRGFADQINPSEEAINEITRGPGGSMDVRGPESRRVTGRQSRADNPLVYVIMQAQEAIVRAEKDRVGRTMLRYVQANPNPSLWVVDTPTRKTIISPITGMVTTIVDPAWTTKPNVFAVKVGGKNHYITFKGPDGAQLARAFKNLDSAQLHKFFRFLGNITRLLARLSTTWNPDFWIKNFERDLGEAFINLQEQDKKKFVRNFLKYLLPAMGGSFRGIRGKEGGRFTDAFNELDKAGGRIRFFGMYDAADVEANVSQKLRRLQGGVINNTITGAHAVTEALDVMSGSLENATRLAAYMAARDAGMTAQKAASVARELTVNFNRKGEWGSALSAGWMFANAAIQGPTRMLQAMKHKNVRRAAYALAATGALIALWNLSVGGDDDDGEALYEKLPRWERDSHIIIMGRPKKVDGKYQKQVLFKIALPLGYQAFFTLGSRIASLAYGKTTADKAIESVVKSTVDSFDPIGRDETAAKILPTLLKPAYHLPANQNWTGRPINPDNPYGRDHRPDSERHFDSASKFSVAAAKKINELTGGSPYKSGSIGIPGTKEYRINTSFSPGTLDYWLNFVGGGAGRFVANSIATPWKLYQGEPWQPEKTPIVRQFVTAIDKEAADRQRYDEQRDAARDAPVSLARKAAKRNEPGAAEALQELSKTATQADVAGEALFDKADRQISKWRAEEKRIKQDTTISEDVRRQKIEEVRAEITAIRNNARKTFKEMQQGR